MENVVATVSGYHGSERFNLIKLISHTGASYVGAMSRSVTHLVCWKFEGNKYSLAKKFGTVIVNHQWIEECIKQGKCVPEGPYRLQSGHEVGPLVMDFQHVADERASSSKHKIISAKASMYEDDENEKSDTVADASDLAIWSNTFSLEKLSCKSGKASSSSHKLKYKPVKERSSSREYQSSSRFWFQDPPLSGLVGLGHGESNTRSSQSSRDKRKMAIDGIRSPSLVSRKVRRLVKKIAHIGTSEHEASDLECHPSNVHERKNYIGALHKYLDCERDVDVDKTGRTSVSGFSMHGRTITEGFDDIEEVQNWNHSLALGISNLHAEVASPSILPSQDCSTNTENRDGSMEDVDPIEIVTRSPPSMELSCVICWTEFSSTRGVLQCGHRFCYSCIQNWADHMVSRGKISTCPLCKASFVSITKVEDAATFDQKIYSQTIPCPSWKKDIIILTDQERQRSDALFVVNAFIGNLKSSSSNVIFASFVASIPIVWTLLYFHGHASIAGIFGRFTIVLTNICIW
ncbi:uncharacterized protein LOC110807261 isoform X3 [Carica papaya]|uniref:uncharacterized protein LOC110807261 isoform X3 n=1 Tax=Carica papaya TaxID=3649 RepID=UPI000B8C80FB|nr:uncharacterized protein LOC110807261 isoform X3 [Carica papaya]